MAASKGTNHDLDTIASKVFNIISPSRFIGDTDKATRDDDVIFELKPFTRGCDDGDENNIRLLKDLDRAWDNVMSNFDSGYKFKKTSYILQFIYRFSQYRKNKSIPDIIATFIQKKHFTNISSQGNRNIRIQSIKEGKVMLYRGNYLWEVVSADDGLTEIVGKSLAHIRDEFPDFPELSPEEMEETKHMVYAMMIVQYMRDYNYRHLSSKDMKVRKGDVCNDDIDF